MNVATSVTGLRRPLVREQFSQTAAAKIEAPPDPDRIGGQQQRLPSPIIAPPQSVSRVQELGTNVMLHRLVTDGRNASLVVHY
jgi:hypothetical protein